ncbi:MAG: tetratricopeptide repeat protein [bacterium]|nr:tetratricopeptide repeat protein [bacterium]
MALSQTQTSLSDLDIRKNEIILSGVDLVYSGKYEEAIKHFKQIEELDPDCAEGIFFEGFVLEFIQDQYRTEVFDERLYAAAEIAIAKAETAVKNNPSARNYMFLGGAYGIKGVRDGILGHWFGAFRNGRKAFKNMGKAIEIDSTIYDCYYGIGTYHYWAPRKLKRFLGPFYPDSREQGMNELDLTIEKGIFSPRSAKIATYRIYIDMKLYKTVTDMAELELNAHPETLFPRWYYGVALVKTNQWQKAIDNYLTMLEILEPIDIKGPEASIDPWYHIGLCYYNLGDFEKAKEYIEKIIPFKATVNKDLSYYDDTDFIKEAERLLKKINKELNSGN